MNKQINLQKTVPMMRHALKKICEVSSNSGRVLFSFFRSVFQSFKLVKKYRPKKVICFGGYATLPILFISVLLGKKTQRLLCLFLLMHFFFPLLFLYGKYTLKEKIWCCIFESGSKCACLTCAQRGHLYKYFLLQNKLAIIPTDTVYGIVNQKRISYGGGSYTAPVWSPRGDLIAFTKSYKGG